MGKCIFDGKETNHYLFVEGREDKIYICEECTFSLKSSVFGYAFPPIEPTSKFESKFAPPKGDYLEELNGVPLKIGDKVRIIGGSIALGEEGIVKGFVVYDRPIDYTGATKFVLVETKVTSVVLKQPSNLKKIEKEA